MERTCNNIKINVVFVPKHDSIPPDPLAATGPGLTRDIRPASVSVLPARYTAQSKAVRCSREPHQTSIVVPTIPLSPGTQTDHVRSCYCAAARAACVLNNRCANFRERLKVSVCNTATFFRTDYGSKRSRCEPCFCRRQYLMKAVSRVFSASAERMSYSRAIGRSRQRYPVPSVFHRRYIMK